MGWDGMGQVGRGRRGWWMGFLHTAVWIVSFRLFDGPSCCSSSVCFSGGRFFLFRLVTDMVAEMTD